MREFDKGSDLFTSYTIIHLEHCCQTLSRPTDGKE